MDGELFAFPLVFIIGRKSREQTIIGLFLRFWSTFGSHSPRADVGREVQATDP